MKIKVPPIYEAIAKQQKWLEKVIPPKSVLSIIAIGERHQRMRASAVKAFKQLKKKEAKVKKGHQRVLPLMRGWMDKNGFLIPEEKEFITWFFSVRHPELTMKDPCPEIDKQDFLAFSKYQDEQFRQGEKKLNAKTPKNVVPEKIIQSYAKKLTKAKILTDESESEIHLGAGKDKVSPNHVIGLILDRLIEKYHANGTHTFETAKRHWKLKRKALKNYTLPATSMKPVYNAFLKQHKLLE